MSTEDNVKDTVSKQYILDCLLRFMNNCEGVKMCTNEESNLYNFAKEMQISIDDLYLTIHNRELVND